MPNANYNLQMNATDKLSILFIDGGQKSCKRPVRPITNPERSHLYSIFLSIVVTFRIDSWASSDGHLKKEYFMIKTKQVRIIALLAASACSSAESTTTTSCDTALSTLNDSLMTFEESLDGTSASVKKDWPSQTIYLKDLMKILSDSSTCYSSDTSDYIKKTVNWLNASIVNDRGTWYQIVISQQNSITKGNKSAETVGNKTWAFVNLDQNVNNYVTSANSTLKSNISNDLNIDAFETSNKTLTEDGISDARSAYRSYSFINKMKMELGFDKVGISTLTKLNFSSISE